MIHKTKVKCDLGSGLGGESQGGLYMTLFYKQLLCSPRFSSVGPLLSESLSLCQAGVVCVCGRRGTVGGGLCHVWLCHCLLSCLLSFFPFCGKAGAKGQQIYLLPLCLSLESDGTIVNFIFHYVGLHRDSCY